jgi:hypothetical protein
MNGQNRWQRSVQSVYLFADKILYGVGEASVDLVELKTFEFVLGCQMAPDGPWHSHYLDWPASGFDSVAAQLVGYHDVVYVEGIEDLQRVRLAHGQGQVVIAGQEEHGNASMGQAADTFGELPLVRRSRVARPIRIAAKQHQVDVLAKERRKSWRRLLRPV